MYHHAGFFVDHHDLIILVHDVQVHGFGPDVEHFGCIVRIEHDLVAGPYLVVRLHALAVDEDHVRVDGLLEFVACDILHAGRQELVDTYRFLSLVDREREPLEQFLGAFTVIDQVFRSLFFFQHAFILAKLTSIQRN
jgi:hypothetical protein